MSILFPSNTFNALHLGLRQVLSFPKLLAKIPGLTEQETFFLRLYNADSKMPLCLFYRSWQSSMQRCYYYIACKKKTSFRVIFLRCKYFKNLKGVFISSTPQVKHKPSVWSHLPHCCLPLGTQHGRTQWKRRPHKAHSCLCNFDYQVINYHSILNITPFIFHYREVSLSLVHSGPCFML